MLLTNASLKIQNTFPEKMVWAFVVNGMLFGYTQQLLQKVARLENVVQSYAVTHN